MNGAKLVGLFSCVIGLVVAGYLMILILQQSRQIDFLSDRNEQLLSRKIDISSIEKLSNDLAKMSPEKMGFLSADSDERAVERLRDIVAHASASLGFQINSSVAQPPKRDGRIAASVLRVALSGPASKGEDLITAIEQSGSAVFFSLLDLTANQAEADDPSRQISINATLDGYWLAPAETGTKK